MEPSGSFSIDDPYGLGVSLDAAEPLPSELDWGLSEVKKSRYTLELQRKKAQLQEVKHQVEEARGHLVNYEAAAELYRNRIITSTGKLRVDNWPLLLRDRAQRILEGSYLKSDEKGQKRLHLEETPFSQPEIIELALAVGCSKEVIDRSNLDQLIIVVFNILNANYECGVTCLSPWIPPEGKFTFQGGSSESIMESIPSGRCSSTDAEKLGVRLKPGDPAGCAEIEKAITAEIDRAYAAYQSNLHNYEELLAPIDPAFKALIDYKNFLDATRLQFSEQLIRKAECAGPKIGGECQDSNEYYVQTRWRSLEDIRSLTDILTLRGPALAQQVSKNLAAVRQGRRFF